MLIVFRWILLVTLLFPGCLSYVITTEPWQTNRPVPGGTIFYNIQHTEGEVVLVDILLISATRGNTTTIFGDSDLTKQDDANAGFTIPFVPPGMYMIRLVATSTKQFLADSPQFEIFPVGTASASSSSATSLPATPLPTFTGLTTTSTSSGSSTSNTAGAAGSDTSTSSESSPPVGGIVGGVLGGLLVLVVLGIVLWRRRQRRAGEVAESVLPTSEANSGSVQPYTLSPRSMEGLGALADPEGGSIYPSSMAPSTAVNRQAGPLPSKSHVLLGKGYGAAGEGSSSVSVTSPMSPEARTDLLRRERERINREIAELENRTNNSGSQGTASMSLPSSITAASTTSSRPPRDQDLAAQLEALRNQIQQMEERQAYGTNAVDFEPPPGYDGPPAPQPIPEPNAPGSGESRPLPTPRTAQIDRKEPL
ncbi:unnamed protein product [Cyclocybe aegerita]|uniref:Uncharacterized protein n=1 Tax=Cyclocybe aegerita TaxID=1973307 RepID=A0A8S0WJK8_CYCAE|nr:unnamed protein product [Cyclocybe aegerita]